MFCSETHISKWRHTERTGKAVVQTAVQTHPAVGVSTWCCDRLPQRAATQHTVKICWVNMIWIHRHIHWLNVHPWNRHNKQVQLLQHSSAFPVWQHTTTLHSWNINSKAFKWVSVFTRNVHIIFLVSIQFSYIQFLCHTALRKVYKITNIFGTTLSQDSLIRIVSAHRPNDWCLIPSIQNFSLSLHPGLLWCPPNILYHWC